MLLQRLGLKYSVTIDRRNQVVRYRIKAKDSRKILAYFDNENIRRIPREILNLNYQKLNLFWKELLRGDGTITKKGTEVFATIYRDLALDVAELLHKTGNVAGLNTMLSRTVSQS